MLLTSKCHPSAHFLTLMSNCNLMEYVQWSCVLAVKHSLLPQACWPGNAQVLDSALIRGRRDTVNTFKSRSILWSWVHTFRIRGSRHRTKLWAGLGVFKMHAMTTSAWLLQLALEGSRSRNTPLTASNSSRPWPAVKLCFCIWTCQTTLKFAHHSWLHFCNHGWCGPMPANC